MTGAQQRISTQVPSADAFVDAGDQSVGFLADDALDELAGELIERVEEFGHLAGLDIAYRWKAEGGVSGGTATLGKCQRASGLLAHFSGVQFVVWLAADHCRALSFAPRQIEALLYRQLSYIGWDDKGNPVLRAADFTGFVREIDRFGLWLDDLRRLGESVKQLPLDGIAA